MPFLVLSIRCTFLRQTLGATPGGERLKRELTVNSSLSQGQKETLPVFSFCSTNVEQIGVFIVSDSTSYQFSPHSSKVVVFFPGGISRQDSLPQHNWSVWHGVQKLVLSCNSTNVSISASDWLLHWQQWKSRSWQHFARYWRQPSNWGDKSICIWDRNIATFSAIRETLGTAPLKTDTGPPFQTALVSLNLCTPMPNTISFARRRK